MNKIRPLYTDKRYTITHEQCEQGKPVFVVRFCDGKPLARSAYYSTALMLAAGDAAQRRGSESIEAMEA
jgi:hypothetical protein